MKVIPENEDVDIFNYDTLNFDRQKILKLEPSMIENLFLCEAVYVKNEKKWFHPAFNPLDRDEKPLSDRLKRNEIAKEAADIGIVPLYELYDSQSNHVRPLHKLVLEKIASTKAIELQHLFFEKPGKITNLLEEVQPEIRDLIGENNDQEIQNAWTTLYIAYSGDIDRVNRRKSSACSGASRPLKPEQSGHWSERSDAGFNCLSNF